jgi:hypothetical protein
MADRINHDRPEPLISYASLGRIECGIQPYSQDTLEAVGAALGVDPFILLTPDDPPEREQLCSLWLQLSPMQRQLTLAIIRAIICTHDG